MCLSSLGYPFLELADLSFDSSLEEMVKNLWPKAIATGKPSPVPVMAVSFTDSLLITPTPR